MNPEKPEQGELLPYSHNRNKASNLQPKENAFRKTFSQERKSAFERELHLLETLTQDHPQECFPTILSHGVLAEGGFYLDLVPLKGKNLHQIIAARGPLPSREILQLLPKILSPLKTLKQAKVIHGDLSPANFFLTTENNLVLLDFEKARFSNAPPIEAETEGFSGGTHGYAPKEAYLGTPPNHSFDLYGLGGVLHFLLVGQIPPIDSQHNFIPNLLHRLRPVAPVPLIDICKRLLSASELRPSIEELEGLIKILPIPDKELETLEIFLLGAPPSDPGLPPHLEEAFSIEVKRRLHWGKKLNTLLKGLPPTPSDLTPRKRLMGAWAFARVIQICLSHLPLLPLTRERLSRASKRIPELLKELPESFSQLREDLKFTEAKHLARLSINLCDILAGIPMDHPNAPRLIADTSRNLHASYQRMEHEEKKIQKWERTFHRDLGVMDFSAAKKTLNMISDYWSGANPTLARLRDRLHRAEWLAEQMAQGKNSILAGLQILGDKAPITAELMGLLQHLNPSATHPKNESNSGINRLARTLFDYQEAFPQRSSQPTKERGFNLRNASKEVQAIRVALTRQCHLYAKKMEDYLLMEPTPLRPILKDLAEADRILFLDSLVDLEEKTRGELYDQLDALRIRIEALADEGHWLSARARDQAERGRLTTALYDMERALKVSRGDEDLQPILSEVERLKDLKKSISAAQKKNRKLAELHQNLLQEKAPSATILGCLDKREEVLQFLAANDPGAQGRWEKDLKNLKEQRVERVSIELEEQFHRTSSPERKLAVCDAFQQTMVRLNIKDLPPGISARWRSFTSFAEAELERQEQDEKQKTFLWKILTVILAILVLIIGLLIFPLL